jgi:hypothetical protein
MAKCFTEEWLDDTKRASKVLLEWPGLCLTVQFVVTGAPEGDIEYYWVFKEGKMVDCKLGHLPDAEVTMTTSYEVAVRIQKGELDPSTVIMQGKVKTTGNMAKVMALLPLSNSAEYRQFIADLAQVTEF